MSKVIVRPSTDHYGAPTVETELVEIFCKEEKCPWWIVATDEGKILNKDCAIAWLGMQAAHHVGAYTRGK